MNPTPKISCRGLTKRLTSGGRTLTVLEDVDLDIAPGEFVAVLGPSGGGKSTLLGLMAGLDHASEGTVHVDGVSLGELNEDQLALLRREKIGFVFQSFHLLGNLTARENVLIPLELAAVPDAVSRTDELLRQVGLEGRMHHYPSQLSGGEQQRVALARAFASRPPIILADEPTGNLDAETGARILELLVKMREEDDVTLILVTHDAELASRAERRVHLRAGRIERIDGPVTGGSPEQIGDPSEEEVAR